MFNRKNSRASCPPRDRINAIAARPATQTYAEASGSRTERTRVFRQGVAILPHGERLPVAIKSVSATGLRIEYFQNCTLPDIFTIKEVAIPLDTSVSVVWRREGMAGLKILRG